MNQPRQPPAGPQRYRIERRVGRVIEARVFQLKSQADVADYSKTFLEVFQQAGDLKELVLCADHRPVTIYPAPVTAEIVKLFSAMNARFLRVAVVVNPANATLSMQLERIVREANFEHRRVFYDMPTTLEHFRSVLTPPELARIRSFLNEFEMAAAPV